MHFNVYIDNATGNRLTRALKQKRKTRNAIIREAVSEWLLRQESEWPNEILSFMGIKNAPLFEQYRAQLLPPEETLWQ